MRTGYSGDDYSRGYLTAWLWVVVLLAAIWLGALVWLVISVAGWIRSM